MIDFERNPGQEKERQAEKVRRRLERAVELVARVNVFGNDETDEFGVKREDGRREGIFKTWAVPVIPFFESGKIDLLAARTFHDGSDFWESVGEEGNRVVVDWVERMKSEPAIFWTSLEKWRALTEQQDRRLALIFSERPLPSNRIERVAELILRLRVAFGVAAPFYHLEAMVGGDGSWFNPVGQSVENGGVVFLM